MFITYIIEFNGILSKSNYVINFNKISSYINNIISNLFFNDEPITSNLHHSFLLVLLETFF